MSLQAVSSCATVKALGVAPLGRPRSQGAYRWIVPARRGRTVRSAPLALLLVLCCVGCADDDELANCGDLQACETLRTECAADSVVYWCDGAAPCVRRCVDVCADLGARWAGSCHYSTSLGHEVCSCE